LQEHATGPGKERPENIMASLGAGAGLGPAARLLRWPGEHEGRRQPHSVLPAPRRHARQPRIVWVWRSRPFTRPGRSPCGSWSSQYAAAMTVIAHFSDIHVDGGERSIERTRRIVRYLTELRTPVDVVLVTGDIADHGAESEYERAAGLMDISGPVLYCPGNHDAREPFRKVLLDDPPHGAPVNRAYQVSGVLFLMCDSSMPGRDDGRLAERTLDWIESELAAAGGFPAFVCFHHPPVILGMPYIDGIRQFATDRLASLVAGHDNVVAVLCGHAHTPASSTFGGKPLIVAPGVVSTANLPFEGDAIVDEILPPMLALHILDEERRLTTHFRVVP
jgi:3',5'-cyclic-AMP phosphodiesterase